MLDLSTLPPPCAADRVRLIPDEPRPMAVANAYNARILRCLDAHDHDGVVVCTSRRGIVVSDRDGTNRVCLATVRAAREWLGYGALNEPARYLSDGEQVWA